MLTVINKESLEKIVFNFLVEFEITKIDKINTYTEYIVENLKDYNCIENEDDTDLLELINMIYNEVICYSESEFKEKGFEEEDIIYTYTNEEDNEYYIFKRFKD